MLSKRRRLCFESLESRRVLSAAATAATVFVDIPANLTGQPGTQVVAPVNIDNAMGIRGAEVRISYDTALLDADNSSVRAGSVWPRGSAAVVANVNDAAGSIVVFVFAAEGLPAGSGSLLEVHFALRSEATVGDSASVDLVQVRLNEGAMAPNPEPAPGPDSTDGRITCVGANGEAIASEVASVDTANEDQPAQFAEMPPVTVVSAGGANRNVSARVAARSVVNKASVATETDATEQAVPVDMKTKLSITAASSASRRPASPVLAMAQTAADTPLDWPEGASDANVVLARKSNNGRQSEAIADDTGRRDLGFRGRGPRFEPACNGLVTATVSPSGSATWRGTARRIANGAVGFSLPPKRLKPVDYVFETLSRELLEDRS